VLSFGTHFRGHGRFVASFPLVGITIALRIRAHNLYPINRLAHNVMTTKYNMTIITS
jgi:hypothetical protein